MNKRLALYGVDNGNGAPVIVNIDGENKSAVTLNADNCIISGLKIRSSKSYCITVLSDLNNIINNTIIYSTAGICLNRSNANVISHNKISVVGNLAHGIFLVRSLNNTIKSNDLSFFGVLADGINLFRSSGNVLYDNEIKGNEMIGGAGILSRDSYFNRIKDNTIDTGGLW